MLDRSRDFCEVWGGAAPWRYEQDGKRFDAEGFEIAFLDESPEISEPESAEDAIIDELLQPDDGVIDALEAAEEAIDQAQAVVAKKRKR